MRIKGKQLEDTLRTADNPFEAIHATQFVGAMDGSLRFKCKNAESTAVSKGQAVYISGVSGDVPEVKLADADGTGTVPAVGLTESAANASAEVFVVSFGNLTGLDTSSLNTTSPVESIVGRSVFIGTTPGQVTIDKPAGSSAKLQNIGQIVREHATEGIIKVGGAGRTAATPNLDQGKFFIGNTSNQSSESDYTLPTAIGASGQVLTSDGTNVGFAEPSSSAMTVETKSANFSAQTNYFYLVSTTAGSTIEVLVPSSPTVGDRIKVFNTGAGTVRVAENTGNLSVNPYDSSGGVSGTSRSVNSKALIELVAVTTQQWSYVLIPQIELDSDTLSTTGEFLMYKASELALKPAPYAMPDSPGSTGQLLAVSSTNNNELEFIDPIVSSLEYTTLVSNLSAANFGGTNYRRPYYYPNITNLTITLPLYTDSNSSSLNGQVIKIINESNYTVGLYISSTNHGSSRYTRLRDSTGELSPFSGSYTYTIPACTSIDLSMWRGSVGSSNFLFYSIVG